LRIDPKVRGFCDHNNFAVVGMAVPERVNLFRAQASRAVGGNGRRTSHNPPDSSMLEIYDRIGIVVMDENRLFDNVTKHVIRKQSVTFFFFFFFFLSRIQRYQAFSIEFNLQ
jgi:beta-galactosidase/beta-glucuronidase